MPPIGVTPGLRLSGFAAAQLNARTGTHFHPRPLCHVCHIRCTVTCGKADRNAMTGPQNRRMTGRNYPGVATAKSL